MTSTPPSEKPDFEKALSDMINHLETEGPLAKMRRMVKQITPTGWFAPYTQREKMAFQKPVPVDWFDRELRAVEEERGHTQTALDKSQGEDEGGDKWVYDLKVKELQAAYELIMLPHAQGDRLRKPPYYIDIDDPEDPLAAKLRQLQVNVNKSKQAAVKEGEAPPEPWTWMPHQLDCIGMMNYLESRYRAVFVCNGMGLAKTAQVAALIAVHQVDGPTLIVAPSSIFPH